MCTRSGIVGEFSRVVGGGAVLLSIIPAAQQEEWNNEAARTTHKTNEHEAPAKAKVHLAPMQQQRRRSLPPRNAAPTDERFIGLRFVRSYNQLVRALHRHLGRGLLQRNCTDGEQESRDGTSGNSVRCMSVGRVLPGSSWQKYFPAAKIWRSLSFGRKD